MAGMMGFAKENLTGGERYSQTLSMIMIWLKEYHMKYIQFITSTNYAATSLNKLLLFKLSSLISSSSS